MDQHHRQPSNIAPLLLLTFQIFDAILFALGLTLDLQEMGVPRGQRSTAANFRHRHSEKDRKLVREPVCLGTYDRLNAWDGLNHKWHMSQTICQHFKLHMVEMGSKLLQEAVAHFVIEMFWHIHCVSCHFPHDETELHHSPGTHGFDQVGSPFQSKTCKISKNHPKPRIPNYG